MNDRSPLTDSWEVGALPDQHKKTAPDEGAAFSYTGNESAFRELEALAGTRATSFFALLHATITGEQAVGLDQFADLRVELGQGAGNAEADRADLTVDATTFGHHFHVELIDQVTMLEGQQNGILQRNGGKILFKGATVDDDLAGAFGQPDVCDGILAATGGGCCGDFAHGIGELKLNQKIRR